MTIDDLRLIKEPLYVELVDGSIRRLVIYDAIKEPDTTLVYSVDTTKIDPVLWNIANNSYKKLNGDAIEGQFMVKRILIMKITIMKRLCLI